MVSLIKGLRVSVVVMLMLVKPSKSNICDRTFMKDNHGCRYYQLSSNNTWCVVQRFGAPDFSFYIKPGHHFNKLWIIMHREGARTGLSHEYPGEFEVERSFLSSSEEWYKIHLSTELGQYLGLSRAYHLYINDKREFTEWMSFTRASVFTVLIEESAFYGTQCIPEDLPPPKGPKDFPSWLISVIVGVAFIIFIIIAIVIAVVMSKKWKAMKEERDMSNAILNDPNWHIPDPRSFNFNESDDPANHVYNELEELNISEQVVDQRCPTISNDPDRHIRDPDSFNFNEFDDPANHIYEEVEEFNISEEVVDQRGPVTFVNDNAGQSVSYHHATPETSHSQSTE